jgi:large subunit ribosomal protein L7/L12
MICGACGTLLSDASRFCNSCGASVGSSEPKDEIGLAQEVEEKKAQSTLSKEEAEKLVQKLAEAGVTIEIKYAAERDDPDTVDADQTNYTVFLHAVGQNKLEVLKIVREATDLPLSNARNLIDVAPTIIQEGLSRRDAETICQNLRGAGAIAEVEPTSPAARLPSIGKSEMLLPLSSSPVKPPHSMTNGCVALLIIFFLLFVCWALGNK